MAAKSSSSSVNTDRGVLLSFRATLPDGQHVSTSWKAHTPPGAGGSANSTFRWELRRVLRALGLVETKWRKMWAIINEGWVKWQAFGLMCGYVPGEHMGRSRHSLLKSAKPVDAAEVDAAEQEFWDSTEILLCMVSCLLGTRRRVSDRDRATVVGARFFEATLQVADVEALAMWDIPPHAMEKCNKGNDAYGLCECLQPALADPGLSQSADMAPQLFMHRKAMALARALPCNAAAAALRIVVDELAAAIHNSVDTWAEGDWPRGENAIVLSESSQKKRRVDFHVRQYVVSSALEDGRQASCSQVFRSLAGVAQNSPVKWRGVEMSAYRATTMAAFNPNMTVSLAVDGSRLGRPAKEVLVGFLSCPSRNLHAALSPQAILALHSCHPNDRVEDRSRQPQAIGRLVLGKASAFLSRPACWSSGPEGGGAGGRPRALQLCSSARLYRNVPWGRLGCKRLTHVLVCYDCFGRNAHFPGVGLVFCTPGTVWDRRECTRVCRESFR